MALKHLLAAVTIAVFLCWILISANPRRTFVQFIVIFFPFIDLNITPDQMGSISVFDFASFFILILAGSRLFSYQGNAKLYFSLLVLFFVSLLTGSLLSEFILNSLIALVKTLSVFIYGRALFQEIMEDLEFRDQVLLYIKWGIGFSLLFLAGQLYWGAAEFTFYPEVNENVIDSSLPRYTSYFQDPQKYAQYLGMVSFLLLMGVFTNSKHRLLNITLFMLSVMALLLSGGRAAALGFSVSLLLLALSAGWWFRIAAVTAISVVYFMAERLSNYFSLFARTDDYTDSYQVRHQIWQEALAIFYQHPFFGVGIGNHHEYVLKHSVDGYYVIDDKIVYYGTENGYLQLLVELGCVGFVLFLVVLLVPFCRGLRQFFVSQHIGLLCLLAALLTWLIAYFTVDSLVDKRILVLVSSLLVFLIAETRKTAALHG